MGPFVDGASPPSQNAVAALAHARPDRTSHDRCKAQVHSVIADQLGHARSSLSQDVYMGRKVRNPRAVDALDAALRQALNDQKDG